MSDSCDPKLLRAPKVVWLLALLAAAHVLFFSAAFPFFNAVDEQLHLDLVVRYAHGEIPRALETLRPDSLHYIAFYGTTEYLCPPQSLPGGARRHAAVEIAREPGASPGGGDRSPLAR